MRIFSSLWAGTSVSPAKAVARSKEQGCEPFNGEGGGSLTRKTNLQQQQQESTKSGAAPNSRLSIMPPVIMGDAAKTTAPTAPLPIGAKDVLSARRRAAKQPPAEPLFRTGAEALAASSSPSEAPSEASVHERVAALLQPTSTMAREVRTRAINLCGDMHPRHWGSFPCLPGASAQPQRQIPSPGEPVAPIQYLGHCCPLCGHTGQLEGEDAAGGQGRTVGVTQAWRCGPAHA